LADKLAAYFCEFFPYERLASRDAQVLNFSQRLREAKNFIHRQVILAVKAAPVKTVRALHVADGIDEQR
jgi:hypothetical protein